MFDWLKSPIVAFLAGALVTAIMREVISSWFGRPRIRLAVSDIWLSSSPHPLIEAINPTKALQNLLQEFPLNVISWTENQFSATTLDRALLETIEFEQRCVEARSQMQELKNDWNSLSSDPTRLIPRIACDTKICARIVGALISYPNEAPQVLQPPSDQKRLFPLQEEPDEETGKKTFVLLDLPGNPSPVVGHSLGIPDLNTKSVALAHALSYGEVPMLQRLCDLAWRYNERACQQMSEIRKELQQIKTGKNFLHLQVVVTNLGKESAVLYPDIHIKVGHIDTTIRLDWIKNDDLSSNRSLEAQVAEYAQSLRLRWPAIAANVAAVGPIVSLIPLKTGEVSTLRFVSHQEINKEQFVAVEALRNNLLSCGITAYSSRPLQARWPFKIKAKRHAITFVQNFKGTP